MTFLDERERALSAADCNVSLLAYNQYFRQLAWTEPLSDEEQEQLLQCLRRGNAERFLPHPNQRLLSSAKHAHGRLLEAYQPLVVAVARRRLFLFKSMDLLDVIQEGNVGVLDALDCYGDEDSANYPFRFFVISRVKYALTRALSERDAFIRLPRLKHDLCIRREMMEKQLEKRFGRSPSMGEVAEALDVSEEVLFEAIEAGKHSQVESLHRVIGTEEVPDDKEQFFSLYSSCVTAEDERQHDLAATFQRVLEAAMTEKQREIVELRYGIGEGCGAVRPVPLVAEMIGADPDTTSTQELNARKRLRRLLHLVVLDDARLSCEFHDLYSEDYCTSGEAAALLGVAATTVKKYALAGLLPFEWRERVPRGGRERVFKRVDVLAVQEQRAAGPLDLVSFRRENASLAQARRSALLPEIVA